MPAARVRTSRALMGIDRRDHRAVYGLLDIVVQASSTFPEGASRVPLEAMAFGRPVVATDIVGNRESVVNKQTGLLVPIGNPWELAEATLMLLNNREMARAYGEQGRRRAAICFSPQTQADQMASIYDDVLRSQEAGC